MKKSTVITVCIIVLLGIGLLFLIPWSASHKTEDSPLRKQSDHTQKHNEKGKETEEAQDKEEDNYGSDEGNFKGKVVNVLKNTVDYFTSRDTHIVAVGDSLTQGVGDSTGEGGYVGILDKTINQKNQIAEFENFGHHGDRTDQLLKRLKRPEVSAAVHDADIVLITIGANDIMQVLKDNITNLTYQKFKEERVYYEGRLRDVLTEITDLNSEAEVYLIGFYNPYDKYFKDIKELALIVNDYNSTGETVTKEFDQVTYIPTKDLFDDPSEDIFADDNFHPNDLGYRKMAKRVLKYITKQER
jgi:lysophospholipase L1-like esterase